MLNEANILHRQYSTPGKLRVGVEPESSMEIAVIRNFGKICTPSLVVSAKQKTLLTGHFAVNVGRSYQNLHGKK